MKGSKFNRCAAEGNVPPTMPVNNSPAIITLTPINVVMISSVRRLTWYDKAMPFFKITPRAANDARRRSFFDRKTLPKLTGKTETHCSGFAEFFNFPI